MAAKKEDKEKVTVINFRDKSSNWWVNNKHYTLTEDNQTLFVTGGLEIEAETEFLRQFINRNKKTFIPREKVAVIEYFEKFTFGKYINQKVDYVKDLDRKYSYDSRSQPTRCKCKRCDKKWMTVKNPKYDYTNIFKEPIFIWKEI